MPGKLTTTNSTNSLDPEGCQVSGELLKPFDARPQNGAKQMDGRPGHLRASG
jgi:hypothetical protein